MYTVWNEERDPSVESASERVRSSRKACVEALVGSPLSWSLLDSCSRSLGFLLISAAASIYLFKTTIRYRVSPEFIGSRSYRWRSLPRVRRHRASKPQGSSERELPWQVTMDRLIYANLSFITGCKHGARLGTGWLHRFYLRRYRVLQDPQHKRMPAWRSPACEIIVKCSHCEALNQLTLLRLRNSVVFFSTSLYL